MGEHEILLTVLSLEIQVCQNAPKMAIFFNILSDLNPPFSTLQRSARLNWQEQGRFSTDFLLEVVEGGSDGNLVWLGVKVMCRNSKSQLYGKFSTELQNFAWHRSLSSTYWPFLLIHNELILYTNMSIHALLCQDFKIHSTTLVTVFEGKYISFFLIKSCHTESVGWYILFLQH